MTKRMPVDDFRAVRVVLEADDYALPGEPTPPTDLIDSAVWHSLMDLPDSVAIDTTDHFGTELAHLQDLWDEWIDAIGDVQDALFGPMLDAVDCFQASTLDLVHGYYRAALASLRAAMEVVAIGTYGALYPSDEVYIRWLSGAANLAFPAIRKSFYRKARRGHGGLFSPDGWLLTHYYELSAYAHARTGAADASLWKSNGPILSWSAARSVVDHTLLTYALCHLFVVIGRSNADVPGHARLLMDADYVWAARVKSAHDAIVSARSLT
jgi:hypothetical protein